MAFYSGLEVLIKTYIYRGRGKERVCVSKNVDLDKSWRILHGCAEI